jgi:hypothetical protein
MTGTIRKRSPRHFELRAYNAATGKQVTKTYAHPRKERRDRHLDGGAGKRSILNPGFHGLSEVTEAFAAVSDNNGSVFPRPDLLGPRRG